MSLSCTLVDSLTGVDALHTTGDIHRYRKSAAVRLTARKWLFACNASAPASNPFDEVTVWLIEQVGATLAAHGPHLVGDATSTVGADSRQWGIVGAAVSPSKAIFSVVAQEDEVRYAFMVGVAGTTVTIGNKSPAVPGTVDEDVVATTILPFSATDTFGYSLRPSVDNTGEVIQFNHPSAPTIATRTEHGVESGEPGQIGVPYYDLATGTYITASNTVSGFSFLGLHGLVSGVLAPLDYLTLTSAVFVGTAQENGSHAEAKFRRHANGKLGMLSVRSGTGVGIGQFRYSEIERTATTLDAETTGDTHDFGGAGETPTAVEFLSDTLAVVSNADAHYAVELDPDTTTIVSVSDIADSAAIPPATYLRAGAGGYCLSINATNPWDARLVLVEPFPDGGFDWKVASV